MNNWHAIKKESVLKRLKTSEEGLEEKEAGIRLEKYGKNLIKDSDKIYPFKIFILQFKSWLIYIFFVAIIISLIIKHFIDASVIFAIVIINALIGFFQQYKAEKSMAELKKILRPKSRVLRKGKLTLIRVQNLVIGDILVLNVGDKVPADCRIIKYENLEVNESILTGESLSVEKTDELVDIRAVIAERKNMLYAGTHIERGNCRAVVVATGMDSEFGRIAGMLQDIKLEETPMQKKMDRFAKNISFFVVSLVVILFILGIYSGQEKYQMLLTAIALAISAIPEGLPAVITIGLALASKKMSKYNTIIRKLPAAETLGSVTVICSDKTGTMTEGKMKVIEIYTNNKLFTKTDNILFSGKDKVYLEKEKELYQLIKTSVLCNNARFEIKESANKKEYDIIGDSTESALVANALDIGINKKLLTEGEKRIKEFSFTSERKIMSMLRENRRKILHTKGAPEVIIRKSSFEFINGEINKLDEKRKLELIKEAERMQKKALRVLGFAFKFYKGEKNIEENLIFLGFVGMQDSPRKEVKTAVTLCKQAGIKIKMITGDSEITAKAIAEQIGIHGKMISGKYLETMNDEELMNKIDKIEIFARIEPKQKLRIIEILKIKNEQVAVTGDGVNDVLALKKADIGIAMGIRGSDIAREVSDIVLIDDNFASIVKAIEEGRIVYDNTKKMTKYLLAVNFSELMLITFTIFLGYPLPLLPLQLLWMNLVTDSFPALSLVKEREKDVMKEKPRKENSLIDNIIWFIIIAGIITFLAEVSVFLLTLNKYPIEEVRTMVITGDIMFELFFVSACRSKRKLTEIGFFSNKWVIYAIFTSLIAHLIILYSPLNSIFGFTPLSFNQWIFLIPFSILGLVLFEAWKYMKK